MDTPDLIRRLSSHDARESAAAEQVLRHSGPDALASLLSHMESQSRRRRWLGALFAAVSTAAGLLACVAALLLARSATWALVAGTWAAMAAFSGLWLREQVENLSAARATAVLGSLSEARAAAPIAEVLLFADPEARAAAEVALTRLLPRVGPESADAWSAHQVECLCRALHGPDVDLAFAALQALRYVGGEAAARQVARLASGRARTVRRAPLRRAASRCLRVMTRRIEQERRSRELLRPAPPPADRLLRVPHRDAVEAQHLLVRPADEDD
ncbi:MAG: hypothetical protein IT208_18790 [Chthonomonadales bacterium]|nr:hypothetical protein [Chthonomonadales bacterium]